MNAPARRVHLRHPEGPLRTPLTWLVIGALMTAAALLSLGSTRAEPVANGIHKIRHVIIIMQENRSFDSYFGTYPGANGIPMKYGVPQACLPALAPKPCVRPFHDLRDTNFGGPHLQANFTADLNRGQMNGFVQQQEIAGSCASPVAICAVPGSLDAVDAAGYHTGADIPNYWRYAQAYVLQDRMFEPINSWSFPSHLYLVSGWSAICPNPRKPKRCVSSPDQPSFPTAQYPTPFAWTDLTFLLHRAGVSWAYYLDHGAGAELGLTHGVPGIWNVLPGFRDVHGDHQARNVQDLSHYFDAARTGTFRQVSWVMPELNDSEHPPALVTAGETYVTQLINAAMSSPEWNSTAIFLAWDDWGGFYDHVVPPKLAGHRYGFRVPGIVISPYARTGYVDHQLLSFNAYLKFIEDDFLGGQRLDPKTDGRPDGRKGVVEKAKKLGNLARDFNFQQAPRPPMLLPEHPQSDLIPPARTQTVARASRTSSR